MNVKEILDVAKCELQRVTVGRVDLINSMGLAKEEINNEEVLENVRNVLTAAKESGLKTGMGGGIDINAIPFIKSLGNLLDFYETRYIIFDNIIGKQEKDIAKVNLNAQRFEANYLEDISNKYKKLSEHHAKRCEKIKERIEMRRGIYK